MNELSNRGLSGLINMGNSCYLNAAIQCLSNVISLTEYFLSGDYTEDIDTTRKEYKMCREYYRILNGLWEDNCVIKPISFKQTLVQYKSEFSGFGQHDSQEVLTTLIGLLHDALYYEVNITHQGTIKNNLDKMEIDSIKIWGEHFKKQYSKILEIFYGQFHSRLICTTCNGYTNNFDPFCSVTVPITAKCHNIYDCFDEYSKVEILNNDNKWKCEHCKNLTNAAKTISIWKLPNVLIIVLKRFNYGMCSVKIGKNIEFPLEELDLKKYVDGYDKYNALYECFAVINHVGSTNFGHYYAYCKNMNGKWYEYDDADVTELKDIPSNNAYVIFYRRNEKISQ